MKKKEIENNVKMEIYNNRKKGKYTIKAKN